MNLHGRSAIITGASQGLGKAIAEHYVRAGADVLVVARGEDKLRQACLDLEERSQHPDQRVRCLAGDVADPNFCQEVVVRARFDFPGPCILVNNAGVYGPMGSIDEVNWDEWVEAIRINLFGTVSMCRAFIPVARARGYGKIINLSGGGATAPLPYISAYAASKAAVVRLTETMAQELKGTGVDVNAIAPGALNTRLLDEVLAAGPDKVGRDFYERSVRQKDTGGTSLDKGASLAVFLASVDSDGITGRLFSAVWDDWPRLPERRDHLANSDVYTLRRITPEDRGLKWCA